MTFSSSKCCRFEDAEKTLNNLKSFSSLHNHECQIPISRPTRLWRCFKCARTFQSISYQCYRQKKLWGRRDCKTKAFIWKFRYTNGIFFLFFFRYCDENSFPNTQIRSFAFFPWIFSFPFFFSLLLRFLVCMGLVVTTVNVFRS